MKSGILAVAALTLLVGCSAKQPATASNDSKEVSVNKAAAGAVVEQAAAADPRQAIRKGLPVSTPTPVQLAQTSLPPAFQTHWGLTPADCDLSRPDAKGLMRITGNKLDFYESTAKITALDRRPDGTVSADLAFEGEGQHWTTRTTFALAMGGTHLVRTDASPHKTYRYQRC